MTRLFEMISEYNTKRYENIKQIKHMGYAGNESERRSAHIKFKLIQSRRIIHISRSFLRPVSNYSLAPTYYNNHLTLFSLCYRI